MPTNRKAKSRPLVALGAAVSLAGLSFYLYQRFASDSTTPRPPSSSDNADQSGNSSSNKTGKKMYKPTLSLSLPSTFIRDPANMALLEDLLKILSQYYIVTLIAPPPPIPHPSTTSLVDGPSTVNSSGPASSSSSPPPQASSSSSSTSSPPFAGSGIESVAALSQQLSNIVDFDSRRVLEYSKEEGKLALSRALACDAHCEVMVEVRKKGKGEKGRDRNGYVDESEDGDRTPRATSPAPHSSPPTIVKCGAISSEEKVILLENYHADMARIRKSSSVLIFLLLPVDGPDCSSQIQSTTSHVTVSELDLETVIQPFLLPGQSELSSRVPGVKIVDERSREIVLGKAWSQAAKRVGALSRGWQ